MEKKYLTIKEYATIKGVSPQAVYKQLSTKLSTFVEVVDGKKMLKIQVLDAEGLNQVVNDSTSVDNQVVNQVDNSSALKSDTDYYRELIDDLRLQLKEKDSRIQKQNDQIVDLSNKIAELFENNQKLQLNYQLLLGDMSSAQEEKKNEKDIIEVDAEGARTEEKIQDEPTKKSWFRRIFGF